jgi:protein arginine kinase
MDQFLSERCSPWLRAQGPDGDVVVSSRVRLARNLAGYNFTNRCKEHDRKSLQNVLKKHLNTALEGRGMVWVDLHTMPPVQRRVLAERRLISAQMATSDEGGAVCVSLPGEGLSVMVNEEDHLRLQAVRAGLDLSAAFADADSADDSIEERTDYAYHPRFGYLTACPTNVGTGLRVSVMLHLPALKLTGELEKVQRAAKAMSLAVRGWMGEGSDAAGDFYQISNQTTLGKGERELLGDFETRVLPQVIDYERQARTQLLDKRRHFIEDQVHRAIGLLRSARLLKTEEAMSLLSHARFGAAAGLHEVPANLLNELTVLVQPGHLQRHEGRAMEQPERRVARAKLCRELLGAYG